MAILEYCKRAEIFDSDGDFLVQAGVEQGPMDSVLLIVPRSFDFHLLPYFQIVFYDPILGMLTCRCSLNSPLDLPEQMRSLRCEIIDRLSQEQRRQDVKVSVGEKVMLHTSRQPGDAVQIPSEGVQATVLNISAGGVYLRTSLAMDKGRRVWFDFKGAGGTIPLVAKILRVSDETVYPSQPLYGYGCRFMDLPARYESQLRSFVFREDRRLRKKD